MYEFVSVGLWVCRYIGGKGGRKEDGKGGGRIGLMHAS